MSVSEALLNILEEKVGFSFLKEKPYLLENKLKKRMRLMGVDAEEKYLQILLTDENEFQALVDLLAVNHTFFFREPVHFAHLRSFVCSLQHDRIKGWCAACSSGQEAYSIGLVLERAMQGKMDYRLLATDIDNQALLTAQKAEYHADELSHIPPEYHEFLVKEGRTFKVSPRIQSKILFRRLNLVDLPYPLKGDLDFIFCRNVFIYFDVDVKHKAVLEMMRLLKTGGVLYLGMSEPIVGEIQGFKKLGNAIYQKQ